MCVAVLEECASISWRGGYGRARDVRPGPRSLLIRKKPHHWDTRMIVCRPTQRMQRWLAPVEMFVMSGSQFLSFGPRSCRLHRVAGVALLLTTASGLTLGQIAPVGCYATTPPPNGCSPRPGGRAGCVNLSRPDQSGFTGGSRSCGRNSCGFLNLFSCPCGPPGAIAPCYDGEPITGLFLPFPGGPGKTP